MAGISLARWLWRPAARLRGISWGDIALAGFLSGYAVLLVSGTLPANLSRDHGGVAAAVAVLAMTAPVAWQRKAPAAAAVAVGVAAPLNEFLIGPMVRCGPALPAVLVIAFFAGTRLTGRLLALAMAFCAVSIVTQACYDPNLSPGFILAGLPILAAACVAGCLVRSRGVAAAALRLRNTELREQREQTARLAVAADRARVVADIDGFLHDRIAAMGAAAAAGKELLSADPAAAQDAFASVETSGRATLSQLRDVVGTLHQERLTAPQPVLAQLGALLESATTADARLQVLGSPRALPAGLELCAYRVVEYLLAALEDTPQARIDVRLRFGPDVLDLDVTGPARSHADPVAAFAVAQERVTLLGGTLRIKTDSGRCAALVRLPLTAGYACP